MQTARLGQCVGRDGLCQIFGGIWAPPLGTPSEARYICSSLIGKPQRFKWCPKPAVLRSGHCAMCHTPITEYLPFSRLLVLCLSSLRHRD